MKNTRNALALGFVLLAGAPPSATAPVLDLQRWIQQKHDGKNDPFVIKRQEDPANPLPPKCDPERGHCPIG